MLMEISKYTETSFLTIFVCIFQVSEVITNIADIAMNRILWLSTCSASIISNFQVEMFLHIY